MKSYMYAADMLPPFHKLGIQVIKHVVHNFPHILINGIGYSFFLIGTRLGFYKLRQSMSE